MTLVDLDQMAALLGDPEVMRYYPHPMNRDQALAWIAWDQRLYHQHGFGLWLVTRRDTGEFVGDCGLTPQAVDGVTELEVGYHVRAVLQGRGYATEAAVACREYAREVLERDRLIAIIDPRNRPSQRVAEKLGLVLERGNRQPRPLEQDPAHLRNVAGGSGPLTTAAPAGGRGRARRAGAEPTADDR